MKSVDRLTTFFGLAALIVAVAGFISPPDRAQGANLPRSVNIGTHAVGSYFNIVGTGVAKVVGNHTPMQTKVSPNHRFPALHVNHVVGAGLGADPATDAAVFVYAFDGEAGRFLKCMHRISASLIERFNGSRVAQRCLAQDILHLA